MAISSLLAIRIAVEGISFDNGPDGSGKENALLELGHLLPEAKYLQMSDIVDD